jgi:hypothetical protein
MSTFSRTKRRIHRKKPNSVIPPEHGDPSRCPGCKAAVPDEYATLPKVVCSECGRWELQTGLVVVPAAGPQGTPPSIARLHAPLWRPVPPQPTLGLQDTSSLQAKASVTLYDDLLSRLAELRQFLWDNPGIEISTDPRMARLRELDAQIRFLADRLKLKFPEVQLDDSFHGRIGYCQVPYKHGVTHATWQRKSGDGSGKIIYDQLFLFNWLNSLEELVATVNVAKQNAPLENMQPQDEAKSKSVPILRSRSNLRSTCGFALGRSGQSSSRPWDGVAPRREGVPRSPPLVFGATNGWGS